jgi:ketosteroid isomerase-like protein
MLNPIKALLLFIVLGGSACVLAASPGEAPAEEVTAQVRAFNGAYERNELDAYFAYYAPDATLWFNAGRVELADYQRDWRDLIAKGGRVEKNVLTDIQVQMGPDDSTAIATYVVDVATRMPDGQVSTEKAHETDVWFRVDGKWRIAHLHYTVEAPAQAPE